MFDEELVKRLTQCVYMFVFNRMFNWVVKVVPQPPEALENDEATKTHAAVRQHTNTHIITHTVYFLIVSSHSLLLLSIQQYRTPKAERVRVISTCFILFALHL